MATFTNQPGSSGVAKAGLATGITGTALGGLAFAKGAYDILRGGHGRNYNCENVGGRTNVLETVVPVGSCGFNGGWEANQLERISGLQAYAGSLEAQRYADNVGATVYEKAIGLSNQNDAKITANLKEAFGELVVTRERLARMEEREACLREQYARTSAGLADVQREISDMRVREQATADAINCLSKTTDQRFDAVYRSIDCAKRECGDAIALEAERRAAADQSIRCYVDARFVPGRLVMPRDSICPEVMPRYNTFTTPTDPAPAVQPVTGSIIVNKQ